MQARSAAVVLAAACLVAEARSPARAEAPLSAIDWLSDSVTAPDAPEAAALPPATAAPGDITVTALDQPRSDAVGLIPPSVSGLPRALWGPATAEDAASRILAAPRGMGPALSRLFKTLLVAEADAPAGARDVLLLARVDRLLEMGALDEAGSLLEVAGLDTPDRFRRYFDVALLQGREKPACDLLRDRPDIAPTYPARIFCLARGGDWGAAALTLETATSLGILTPEEDILLARFLDPDIIDDTGPGEAPVTPLNFRLREALGEPVPTRSLPLAFAWSDLRPTRGWKAQIEAAERLARSDAIPANQLFGLYLRHGPSASGGVWDRAEAIQRLERAVARDDAGAVDAALVPAWEAMAGAGLGHALAEHYGAGLVRFDLPEPARGIAMTAGLLSRGFERAALLGTAETARERFVTALARGVPETAVAADPLAESVREGFLADGPPPEAAFLLSEGRVGEAILRAIGQFADGAHGDMDGIAAAIATLRALGLGDHARRAALELLLQDALG